MRLSRRSTLKAIAAAIMAPTIHLREAIPDERLLMAFCNPDVFRFDFDKPFGVGSLTYASDSYSLIRCELASRVEDGERHLPKNVIEVWDAFYRPTQWRDLTPDDLIPTEGVTGLCPYCGDRRVSFGVQWPTDQEYADDLPDWDPDDNTIRDKSCKHCHGCYYEGPSCVRIGGILHDSWRLRRILALPNPRVCAAAVVSDDERISRAIVFKADGFEGISLGIYKEGGR